MLITVPGNKSFYMLSRFLTSLKKNCGRIQISNAAVDFQSGEVGGQDCFVV